MLDLIVFASATAPGLGSLAEIWQAIVHDFSNLNSPAAVTAFGQVVLIDLVFAADTILGTRKLTQSPIAANRAQR